ncbi:GMC oxidoreductase [Microbacterium sp. 22215]|uniref:GMC oxidoreductase n=1 Tax=Microbacterium sp. 22215 TaxID=3453893 RepID=UPI003F83AB9C
MTRVIVVGSGPIGSVYTRLLLDALPDVNVLMVEAGPDLSPHRGENLRNIADRAAQAAGRVAAQGPNSTGLGASVPGAVAVEGTLTARQGTHLVDDGSEHSGHSAGMPAAAQSTGVGGQGAHWTCATPRPEDTERVDFIDDAEWDGLITDAEKLLHVVKNAFADSSLGKVVRDTVAAEWNKTLPAGREVGIFPTAVSQERGEVRWTGTDTILGDILDDTSERGRRFELRASTLATKLELDGDTVTGVFLRNRKTGEDYVESADLVVVAADAFRTPQLLWASGVRPAALGRYLTEHPVIFGIVALSDRTVQQVFPDGVPVGENMVTAAGDLVSAMNRIPFVEGVHPFTAQLMHLKTSPVPLPEGHPLADNAHGYVNVGWALRKFPRLEDGLTFSDDETDAFGMPNITIDYALTEREEAEAEQAIALQARTAALLGDVIPGGEARLLPAGSSLHYQGTFRTGAADDGTSVIDPWSRVWGLSNLYLGGNGTIPTATTVNPTLFSTALAIRGARAAIEQLSQNRSAE